MRLVHIRWSTEPPGLVRFDPHLTVLADFPRPDGGFAGFDGVGELLASLAEAGDDVEATVGNLDGSPSLESAAQQAAREVTRVDAEGRDVARRAIQQRRSADAADMRRIELAVSRVEADAVLQEARGRLREREAEEVPLRAELAEREVDADTDARPAATSDQPEEGAKPEGRPAVEEALETVEQIEMSEPVVPETGSVELIDRWLDLTTSIAFLSDVQPNGMTFEQAADAVTGTRPVDRRTDVGQVGPDVAEKLLDLHRAVERAEKHAGSTLSGRGARRALAQAREAERELLASAGFGDYTEYLMSVAFSSDAPTLDQAEASATRIAEERLLAGDAVQLADDERWSDLERDLNALRTDISTLLGEEASGDPLEALRNRVVLNPDLVASREELSAALSQVGVEVADDEHITDRARAWLQENSDDDERAEAENRAAKEAADIERERLTSKLHGLESEMSTLTANVNAAAVPVEELDAQLAALDGAADTPIGDIADMDPADTVAVMKEMLLPASNGSVPVVIDRALDEFPAASLSAAFGFLMEEAETHQMIVVASSGLADFADDWLTARHGQRGTVWRWNDVVEAAVPEALPLEEPEAPADQVEVPDLDPEPLPDLNVWTDRATADSVPDTPDTTSVDRAVESDVEPEVVAEPVPEVATLEVVEPTAEEPPPAAPDPAAVAATCANHGHRRASTRCSKCNVPYCDDCLVQIGSGSKPRNLCVECALLAGGVRVSRRRRRRRR